MCVIETDWGEMGYSRSGQVGPTLVFLHGTGCDSADWAPTFEQLPPEQARVAMDFRGHGASPAPERKFTLEDLADDVLALVDHLALERPVLVGHSLGGMVAMAATRREDRIAGLVLLEGWTSVAAGGRAFDEGRRYGALDLATIEQIEQKADRTLGGFSFANWAIFWDSVTTFDAHAYLETAAIPILEVYGALGRNARSEQELGVPPNPAVEWVWIPGAGHYLPHERPAEVAAACLRGLARVGG